MGAKFRRKVAAGQSNKAIASLTNDVRRLAGFVRVNAMAQQAVVRALVEHLGCEKEVRAIVQKYEDEMRKSGAQKVPTVTAAEVNGGPVAPDSKFTDDTPVEFSTQPTAPAEHTST